MFELFRVFSVLGRLISFSGALVFSFGPNYVINVLCGIFKKRPIETTEVARRCPVF